jgi:hypothetical protein
MFELKQSDRKTPQLKTPPDKGSAMACLNYGLHGLKGGQGALLGQFHKLVGRSCCTTIT